MWSSHLLSVWVYAGVERAIAWHGMAWHDMACMADSDGDGLQWTGTGEELSTWSRQWTELGS